MVYACHDFMPVILNGVYASPPNRDFMTHPKWCLCLSSGNSSFMAVIPNGLYASNPNSDLWLILNGLYASQDYD